MIKRMLYLNGLAVLTVILYHSSAWGFIGMFFWTDRYRPVSVPNFDQLFYSFPASLLPSQPAAPVRQSAGKLYSAG
jgi:hypothetical protein